MFKVSSKDTRTTSVTLFWCFYFSLCAHFTAFSSVSIVDFEHVLVCQVIICLRMWCHFYSCAIDLVVPEHFLMPVFRINTYFDEYWVVFCVKIAAKNTALIKFYLDFQIYLMFQVCNK